MKEWTDDVEIMDYDYNDDDADCCCDQKGDGMVQEKLQIAKEYAINHSINNYKVKGNRMIYYKNSNGLTTKYIVRLNTLNVEEQQLNYLNKKGETNQI